MTVGGLICIREGEILDYAWKESVQSLLPICDTVTLCIGTGGKDNTEELAREWMATEPKIVICMYEWPNPKGNPDFWVDWLQYGKHHTPTDYLIQLDGDEVAGDWNIDHLKAKWHENPRTSFWFTRHNFWRSPQFIIPKGFCCSDHVVRAIPRDIFLPSDGPDPRGAEATNMAVESGLDIFHLGFLRKREAWFKKARALQGYFFDTYDKRLEAAEKYEGEWATMPDITGWENQLVPFTGTHPAIIKPWLKERGYDIS